MIPAEKIIIALDTTDVTKINKIYEALSGKSVWIKVGMELFYAMGPKSVHDAKEKGFKVFLDLKLHDIPNTVAQGLRSLLNLPIDMVNIHAAGGSEMMKRSVEIIKGTSTPPLLIAVTQLTSSTQEQMNLEQRIPGELLQSVVHYAKLANQCGCDGVVSSPQEVESIKMSCGKEFITVTPGIRPAGSDKQDQKRITTPLEAIKLETDFMVIGRPITLNSNPREALEKILRGE